MTDGSVLLNEVALQELEPAVWDLLLRRVPAIRLGQTESARHWAVTALLQRPEHKDIKLVAESAIKKKMDRGERILACESKLLNIPADSYMIPEGAEKLHKDLSRSWWENDRGKAPFPVAWGLAGELTLDFAEMEEDALAELLYQWQLTIGDSVSRKAALCGWIKSDHRVLEYLVAEVLKACQNGTTFARCDNVDAKPPTGLATMFEDGLQPGRPAC
jgi:hypothetical protein